MPDDVAGQLTAIESLFTDPQAYAVRRSFHAGEIVIDETRPSPEVMFLHSGEVRVFQCTPDSSVRLGAIFGPGEWFGAAAIAGCALRGRAIASVETEVSILPADRLLALLHARPDAAVEFLKEAARRLMRAYDETTRLMFNDCNARLIDALIDLSTRPSAERIGPDVTVRITHQELAQAVGAARETISLALTGLRHKNLLQTGRSRLTFNPQLLMSFKASLGTKSRRDHATSADGATSAPMLAGLADTVMSVA
jgi:CRP-like cAMP-binding protein